MTSSSGRGPRVRDQRWGEDRRGGGRAPSAAADGYHRLLLESCEIADALGDLAHRKHARAGNVAAAKLFGLAHVEENGPGAAAQLRRRPSTETVRTSSASTLRAVPWTSHEG